MNMISCRRARCIYLLSSYRILVIELDQNNRTVNAIIKHRIIRGGTDCYTIALCAQAGHEDACLSFRDISPDKINRLTETVIRLKKEGVESQANPFTQFKMSPAGRIEGAS